MQKYDKDVQVKIEELSPERLQEIQKSLEARDEYIIVKEND